MELGIFASLIESIGVPASFAFMVFAVWYFTRRDARERDARADTTLKAQIDLASQQTKILDALKNVVTANTTQFSDGVDAIKNEIKQATDTITGKMDEHHTIVLGQFTGILDKVTLIHQMFQELKSAWQEDYEKTASAMKAFETKSQSVQTEILASIRKYLREDETYEKVPVVSPNHHRFTDE